MERGKSTAQTDFPAAKEPSEGKESSLGNMQQSKLYTGYLLQNHI